MVLNEGTPLSLGFFVENLKLWLAENTDTETPTEISPEHPRKLTSLYFLSRVEFG